MDLEVMNVRDKLTMAIETLDVDLLSELMSDRAMIVRRAVARNKATPTNILNILAFDQVSNVVYQALNHTNCTVTREIKDANHPCVTCNVRGDKMDCGNCHTINEFCA